MTKVEELLVRLLRVDKTPLYCAQGECGFTEGKHIPTRAELEELVVAGTEQEKEKIRDNSLHYRQFDKMEPNIVAGEHNDYAVAQENLFVVMASVLAPTKEGEK